MSYSENILYQMEYFPEMVKSYQFTADQGDGKKKDSLSGEKTLLYILLTGGKKVPEAVKDIFSIRIPEEMQEYDSCIVEYSLQDQVNVFQDVLRVKTMHSSSCGGCSHYISTSLREDMLKKAHKLFLYGSGELGSFDALYIRKYMAVDNAEDLRAETLGELKESLADCKVYHTLRLEGENAEAKSYLRTERGESVLLQLVQLLYDHFKEHDSTVIRLCREELRRQFAVQSRRVLSSVLEFGKYMDNYVSVEIYLDYTRKVYQELNTVAEQEIVRIIRGLKEKPPKKSDLHNLLLDNDRLSALDDFIKEKVEGLYGRLEERG